MWCCSYCGSSKTPGRDSAGLRPLYWPRPRYLKAPWRGLCFGALSALCGTSGGATMTIPGGAGTSPMHKGSFLRARRIGFYHGSEFPSYRTPALRSARPDALSPIPLRSLRRTHKHDVCGGVDWGLWLREKASTVRTTIKAQARSDGLRLLRTINDIQAHGQEPQGIPSQSGARSRLGGRLRALRGCHGLPHRAGRVARRRAYGLRRRCWRPTPPRLRLLLLHQAGADSAGGMIAPAGDIHPSAWKVHSPKLFPVGSPLRPQRPLPGLLMDTPPYFPDEFLGVARRK